MMVVKIMERNKGKGKCSLNPTPAPINLTHVQQQTNIRMSFKENDGKKFRVNI